MDSDKKKHLLLVPLIFIVLLHVPAMILAMAPKAYLLGGAVFWNPCVLILGISMLIWWALFLHIPIGVYIALMVVYTVVSWIWILRRKKGNAVYFIVWLVLCVLSMLMYWKWGIIYHSMRYM